MSKLKEYDDSYRTNSTTLIAGFDEAGRGPLCGPVVAAGVILPSDFGAIVFYGEYLSILC